MRDLQAAKGGVRRGESRNGCPPPAGKFAHDEKFVYIAGLSNSIAYHATHIHANETAFYKEICNSSKKCHREKKFFPLSQCAKAADFSRNPEVWQREI